MKKTALLLTVIVLAGVAGFLLQRMLSDSSVVPVSQELPADPVIGQPRPEFALKDLDGELRSISEWDGEVILLNFWATWCPPCLREIPALIDLQRQYGDHGLQVVSIAIDDIEAIGDFADDMGINYPVLPGELEGIDIARQYGNRIGGLPFTAFISKNSEIAHISTGELTLDEARSILRDLGVTTSTPSRLY